MKKAEIVADQIGQTIVGRRWEPGELFGSEMELIARYGVSRAERAESPAPPTPSSLGGRGAPVLPIRLKPRKPVR